MLLHLHPPHGLISPKNDRRNKRVRNKDKAVKDGLSDHSEEKRQKLEVEAQENESQFDSLVQYSKRPFTQFPGRRSPQPFTHPFVLS